ncbi:MAG TPA: hypothetical protein VGG71_07185, partial [Chitinophagaceae bacterium]
RHAKKDTIILADGFSCREQIEQETGRKGMHLAQILQMALQPGKELRNELPERFIEDKKLKNPHRLRNNVLMFTALGFGIAIGMVLKNKKL